MSTMMFRLRLRGEQRIVIIVQPHIKCHILFFHVILIEFMSNNGSYAVLVVKSFHQMLIFLNPYFTNVHRRMSKSCDPPC